MGLPAARINDPTAHGKPLSPGPGATTVLIGGQPAWRVGIDFHTCPLVTALVPHVGGVVSVGSTTVMIEGSFAARQSDQVIEVGPPNPIAKGEPTVLIG